MRYIFTESQVRHIIKEAREHTNDEIVDFNEINLQYEFNKLNDLLFGGELYPIEMGWNKRRSAHGLVRAQKNKRTNIITIKSLEVSKFLAITYKHFKDVLAHEMIHVYWLQKHVNAGHDHRFKEQMHRINNMNLGFNVTVTADSSQFELSQDTKQKKKELVFFVNQVDNEEKKRVSVFGYGLYKADGETIGRIYNNLTKTGKYKEIRGEFYLGDNPELQRHRIQRSFGSSVSYENTDPQKVEELKQGAKLLSSFVATNGEITWDGEDVPTPGGAPAKPKVQNWFNI